MIMNNESKIKTTDFNYNILINERQKNTVPY